MEYQELDNSRDYDKNRGRQEYDDGRGSQPRRAEYGGDRRGPQDAAGESGGSRRGQQDTLQLQDYKQQNLQKLHAQSSAETSGLGDSLQRIQPQSSTETSGYGEGPHSPPGPQDYNDNVDRKASGGSKVYDEPDSRPNIAPVHRSSSPQKPVETSPKKNSINNGLFLGVDTDSAWLNWSRERRNSFKRRIESIDDKISAVPENRVSTPVMKARQESVKFVHPRLHKQHTFSEEDDEKPKSHGPVIPISRKARLQKTADDLERLSLQRWRAVIAFWEQPLFRICRSVGTWLFSLLGFILGVNTLVSENWYTVKVVGMNGILNSGLFVECITYQPDEDTECSNISTNDWQNAVIGLLCFGVAFGFLATILSICGIITTTLSKKIYYYHSAGEIFFICAVSCTAAMIAYPVAVNLTDRADQHTYGYGYGLGWGAAVSYYAAAMCMCLDDLVRTIIKGLCCHFTTRT